MASNGLAIFVNDYPMEGLYFRARTSIPTSAERATQWEMIQGMISRNQ